MLCYRLYTRIRDKYITESDQQPRFAASDPSLPLHYEDIPIQIYWKFYHQKMKKNQIKILIIFMFLLKT